VSTGASILPSEGTTYGGALGALGVLGALVELGALGLGVGAIGVLGVLGLPVFLSGQRETPQFLSCPGL